MPRSLVLSNGYLAACLDDNGFVRDLYYPHVGLENHVAGNKHRIGIMVDGYFSWLDSEEWKVTTNYEPGTLVGTSRYHHQGMAISLTTKDVIYNELPIFLREFTISNPNRQYKDIKLFVGQEFAIGESKFRNTAFYDPTKNCILHYKGRRVFLVNGRSSSEGIDDYTIGMFAYEGREGSWRDAEDGQLSKNAVEHGPADSVIRLCASCGTTEEVVLHYWICAAETIDDAYKLNEVVLRKTPSAILHSTESYWKAWVKTSREIPQDTPGITLAMRELYNTSLVLLRSHLDHDGGIIASLDSDMLLYGKDSYAYVWPRDGAYNVIALDKAGYTSLTRSFFLFCRDVLHPDGYLHHKFQPDKSLGSTWHSSIRQKEWLENKILQLPIQEDEIAGVLYALWHHYEHEKDIEFIETLYKSLIERGAEFLAAFRDKTTGLPISSYDLWEEVTGVTTYTICTVIAGLRAAARFSRILGKDNHADRYEAVASDLRRALKTHLFDPERKSFIRVAEVAEDGSVRRSPVIDMSSLYGLWYYDILPPDDPQFLATVEAVEAHLHVRSGIGGFVRYEGDQYYRSPDQEDANPWIITTLWDLQRRMKVASSLPELETLIAELQWTLDRLGTSSVLAEQFDPRNGAPRSATPLAWSHAVYIETVLMYLDRRTALATLS